MNAVKPRRLLPACAATTLAAGLAIGALLLALPGKAAASGPVAAADSAGPMDLPKPATKIYKSLSGGTTSFSDRPPSHGAYVVIKPQCFACSPTSTVDWHATRLYRDAFASEIERAARQYNVDPALVRAVIHAESGFNVDARSPKGAVGLMQLMPATARELGVRNARVPHENIHGGTRYLAAMMVRFRNDLTLATAAYNAGPQAVQKHAGVPPYAETQVYVQRVRILHQRYKASPQG
ncbi:MAG: lytic transglycosylase domain-containing protein [Hylemonella sp.]|nr:lytic transglycosylase domain-containing protein [Hylemonella sp.]